MNVLPYYMARRRAIAAGGGGGGSGFATAFCYYDPSDAATCWQDTAGTTPAGDDDPVGRIDDESGNGHHLIQATADNRPIRRDDGAGHWYLDFDGSSDQMSVSFGEDLAQPNFIAVATRLDVAATQVIYSGVVSNKRHQLFTTTTPQWRLVAGILTNPFGSAAINTPFVVSSVYNGASSPTWVNGTLNITASVGAEPLSGLLIGNQPAGGALLNGRIYGFGLWSTPPSDEDRGLIEEWLADKSGATLS